MTFHQFNIDDTLKKLSSRPEGLTDEQAATLRKQHGFNEIPETGLRPWWQMLLNQFKSTLILILFIAAIIAGATGHMVDVYVILAVIFVNATIGFVEEIRAEKAVASLKSMMVPQAKVMRGGEKISIEAKYLVPGDIIILEEGDSIPADARLIKAKNARAIEAPLTGESVPVGKKTDALSENTALADRNNMLWKGTYLAGGYAVGVVTAIGLKTAIGDIAQTLQSIKPTKTNFQKKTDVLARQMGTIAIINAVLLFSVGYFFRDYDWNELLLVAIAAMVSSIPEGLPAVLAIVLAIGAHRMSKRNAIIREFTATETLGAVTTILTDKTGTLTQNTLTVRRVALGDGTNYQISGEGWSPIGSFMKDEKVLEVPDEAALQQLLRIAHFSNNSEIKHDQQNDTYKLIGDPTEGALLALARKGGSNTKATVAKIDDMPFNSSVKMRATLVEKENQRQLLIVGAPEKVLMQSTSFLGASGIHPMTEAERTRLREQIEQWSGDALRVIALAYRDEAPTADSIDENNLGNLILAGITGMIDPPRTDVKDAIAVAHKAGIRVIMATGDHIKTGVAIAKAVGIITDEQNALALTEQQLLELDEKEFLKAVKEVNVFARLTPDMKLRIAETLQKSGELIAMTGDGVNDAPALKKADVGVAMGIMGTDVARDAAKVVLADDNFSTIVHAVEEGRIVFTNARQTSFFLLTTNFAEIITLMTAMLAGMPVPLTATQILWLNLVTDGVGDKALAAEQGHGEVLEQKPVSPAEPILNKSILPFLLINAVLMTILSIGAFQWFIGESLEKARAGAFITMAFCQLYNLLNMRSLKYSIFKIGLFSNRYINIALIISIIIQVMIIEIPFFERLFHFDPVSFPEFAALALLASLVLWGGELFKFINNKMSKT